MRYILAFLLLFTVTLCAQDAPAKPSAPAQATSTATQAAHPADVKSMDSILAALYDVISGPAGKKRDWDRFRSLFLPGATLVPTGKRPSGEVGARVLTPEDYITRSAPLLEKEGFFERETARHVDQFGNIAQVFSTYESRHKPDEAPFARGINSMQLMNDGLRWWVVTIFWQGETPATPIPPEFQPKARR